jgi:hypothetical protein
VCGADHRLSWSVPVRERKLVEDGGQVLLSSLNRQDVVVIHQHLQHRRCDERRQAGTEANVPDSQVQQRQQNRHRLLLIPGEHQRKRQVVHPAAERIRQRHGDLDGRVGIVALADVQQARQARHRAEIQLIEAVLAAGQRQNDGVSWRRLRELGVVVAARLGAVAAADQEEMADRAALHAFDHRARRA